MDPTTAFTGGMPVVLIGGAILTALISILLLRIYRRAVIRAMSMTSGLTATPFEPANVESTGKHSTSGIRLVDLSDHHTSTGAGKFNYRQAILSLNKTLFIYAAAGVIYSIILTSAWSMASGDGFAPTRFLFLFTCFIWPIFITAGFINHFLKTRILFLYGVLFILVSIFTLLRNPESSTGQLAILWLLLNAPGTILLWLFLNRKVRAIGPLVLAFLIAALTGSVILIDIAGNNDKLLENIAAIGSRLNLSAPLMVIILVIAGFVIFGLFGWLLLRWIGKIYQKKRISDQMVTLDAIWLLFSIVQTFTLVFSGKLFIVTGIIAFIAYKAMVHLGFNIFFNTLHFGEGERRLLLLRVFSLGRRSEKLFDVISEVSLRNGSISLIAGPDLVTTNLEPHEFLSFMGGRLSRQFVSDEKDMQERVNNMDTRPDPDGRYRVNEFFCRADTWQMTMRKLAVDSNAVIMDLRSFSSINQGCKFEIGQLLNDIPLDRILLIVDESTDFNFLEETVRTLYQQITPSSPNYNSKEALLRYFTLKNKGKKEIKNLLLSLYNLQPR